MFISAPLTDLDVPPSLLHSTLLLRGGSCYDDGVAASPPPSPLSGEVLLLLLLLLLSRRHQNTSVRHGPSLEPTPPLPPPLLTPVPAKKTELRLLLSSVRKLEEGAFPCYQVVLLLVRVGEKQRERGLRRCTCHTRHRSIPLAEEAASVCGSLQKASIFHSLWPFKKFCVKRPKGRIPDRQKHFFLARNREEVRHV